MYWSFAGVGASATASGANGSAEERRVAGIGHEIIADDSTSDANVDVSAISSPWRGTDPEERADLAMPREPRDLSYVLDNLGELVVKEVHGSGGYGMLIGPAATKATIEAFRDKLKREPEGFIAQPTLALSTCPTCTASGLAPRHVDLRPFVLTGSDRVTIVPGGLTRVALKEGSLVVNSSQGGGTKDTWILDE